MAGHRCRGAGLHTFDTFDSAGVLLLPGLQEIGRDETHDGGPVRRARSDREREGVADHAAGRDGAQFELVRRKLLF